ncbi:hypothetical protein EW145_g2788 [Phellinidium pouzarii]|uniref:Peptidyl-prolyl cis-trans isomerase n=1 Tax=Phellinidium pouzarii TaxID=167371 RepID=A0A4S4L9S9_9AGAM|nr:hypothetical protein EW145_g2788 [Phellinidium pouzarii]
MQTCHNFYELTKSGYYNRTNFHRIISDFMVQGGDPTGTGRGGTSIYGGKFDDEINPELRFTGAGILAMANSGPNSNGSQFFLTLAPTPFLDNKHTIFGRVSAGMRVVQRLGAVATTREGRYRPVEDVKIHQACVVESEQAVTLAPTGGYSHAHIHAELTCPDVFAGKADVLIPFTS